MILELSMSDRAHLVVDPWLLRDPDFLYVIALPSSIGSFYLMDASDLGTMMSIIQEQENNL